MTLDNSNGAAFCQIHTLRGAKNLEDLMVESAKISRKTQEECVAKVTKRHMLQGHNDCPTHHTGRAGEVSASHVVGLRG